MYLLYQLICCSRWVVHLSGWPLLIVEWNHFVRALSFLSMSIPTFSPNSPSSFKLQHHKYLMKISFLNNSNPLCPSLSLLSFRVPSFLHYFWFNNATADAASITLAQTSWKLLANLIRFVHYDTSLLGSYWCSFPFSLEIQRKMNEYSYHNIYRVCVM